MLTRILLCDDHAIVRQGLRALLEREGFTVVAEACNGHEAVKLAQDCSPDVAVLDITMPLLNGIEAARQLRRVCPKSKLLLLTMHTEDSYVLEALRAGIQGYILKSRAATELIQAIQQVCQGKMYLSPGVSQTVIEAYLAKTDLPPEPLTHREREVLQLVAEGKTTKEVAQFLGVSVKTAESHRMNIMQKLDIHETANLVRYAIRRGLIEP